MQIEPLVKIDQVQEGDLLLISDGRELTHAKAQRVKVSERDGTEVIFNLRKNKYFNVGMYLDGKSWAKDVRVVRIIQSAPHCN
jgi:ribosomal protein L14E/L6E/L27E